MKDLLFSSLINAFASFANAKSPSRLPDWFIASLTKAMDGTLSGVGNTVKTRSEAFDAALAALAEATAQGIRDTMTPHDQS